MTRLEIRSQNPDVQWRLLIDLDEFDITCFGDPLPQTHVGVEAFRLELTSLGNAERAIQAIDPKFNADKIRQEIATRFDAAKQAALR